MPRVRLHLERECDEMGIVFPEKEQPVSASGDPAEAQNVFEYEEAKADSVPLGRGLIAEALKKFDGYQR